MSNFDLLCPIDSINRVLAFASKDWSLDKNDAWIYGIVAGWDDESIEELKVKFQWSAGDIERLKLLNKECSKLRLHQVN